MSKRVLLVVTVIALAVMIAACAPTPAPTATSPTAAAAGKFQIPDVEKGKFNVAFIYVGPHDDAGWSQAHEIGRQYVDKNMPTVHTAYVENVPEGTESEQVVRAVSAGRKHEAEDEERAGAAGAKVREIDHLPVPASRK